MVLANSGLAVALTSNKQKTIILKRLVTEYRPAVLFMLLAT